MQCDALQRLSCNMLNELYIHSLKQPVFIKVKLLTTKFKGYKRYHAQHNKMCHQNRHFQDFGFGSMDLLEKRTICT